MANINAGDFKKGLKVILNGAPHEMTDCQFVKPGKGQALYRTRLRNLLTGKLFEETYRSGDSMEAADIRKSPGSYSYRDGTGYVFLDNATFDTFSLSEENCGHYMKFLMEGAPVDLMFWNEQLIAMTPPQQVELEVTYAEPAARGNTSTNVTKGATVETGAEVQVPAFIEQGNRIRIEVETGTYVSRVST
jgi:elongation factor P